MIEAACLDWAAIDQAAVRACHDLVESRAVWDPVTLRWRQALEVACAAAADHPSQHAPATASTPGMCAGSIHAPSAVAGAAVARHRRLVGLILQLVVVEQLLPCRNGALRVDQDVLAAGGRGDDAGDAVGVAGVVYEPRQPALRTSGDIGGPEATVIGWCDNAAGPQACRWSRVLTSSGV